MSHSQKAKIKQAATGISVKAKKPTSFSYTARMDIDRKQEMSQIFDEAWRVLNDGFYDPNFHGKDWNALKATYKPIALSASTIQDFRVIFNEMLGQLNASHMGLRTVGISCMTNMAAGIGDTKLDQDEVIVAGKKVKPQFTALLTSLIAEWK